ncbi:hypothetical protein EC968_005401 [Mortierella alpina]|nr:hypothetical protein EC968_005401 [Mortierella alpina]
MLGELDGDVLGEDVADTDEVEDEEREAHDVERFASEKGWSEREFVGGNDGTVPETDDSGGERAGARMLVDVEMFMGLGDVNLVGIETGMDGRVIKGVDVRGGGGGGPERTSAGVEVEMEDGDDHGGINPGSGATVNDSDGGEVYCGIDDMGDVEAVEEGIDVGVENGLLASALGPAKDGGASGPVEPVSILTNDPWIGLKVVGDDSRLGRDGSNDDRTGDDGDEVGAAAAVMLLEEEVMMALSTAEDGSIVGDFLTEVKKPRK